MTEPSGREVEFPDLVFDYDVQLLNEICERLRFHDYGITQFIPTRRSWAAATSEYKNLLNLANPRSHRLFSYSIFPWPYTQLMCRGKELLSTCLDACFFNRWMPRDKLVTCFGHELVDRAVNNRVLDLKDGHLRFNVSFVPFQEYLFVRDRYDTYPPYSGDAKSFRDRIWMGADSVSFATFLSRFLRGRSFDDVLEVGSGSGIQIIIASQVAKRCVATDYNKRAVKFTEINAALNDIRHLEALYSDLYENVEAQYDLILANPWYCDLETGGLEEVPGIIDGLKQHLRGDGLCVMILQSYVKRGNDMVLGYLRDFVDRERYDLDLYTLRYGIEPGRASEWKEYGVTHTVTYNAVLRKDGRGAVRVHEAPLLKKIGNFGQIHVFRTLHNI